MRHVQRGISMTFLVIAILAIAVASAAGYFTFSQNLSEKIKSINSFEECAKHYPVMESYPEQCNTPDGKHFTRQLTEEDKQRLVQPTQPPLSVDAKTSNWKVYTNKESGFEFRYPQDWEVKRNYGPNDTGIHIGPMVEPCPSDANAMNCEYSDTVSFFVEDNPTDLSIEESDKRNYSGPYVKYREVQIGGLSGKRTTELPGQFQMDTVSVKKDKKIYKINWTKGGFTKGIKSESFEILLSTFRFL